MQRVMDVAGPDKALADVMVDKGRSGEAGHLPCALPPFLGEVGPVATG